MATPRDDPSRAADEQRVADVERAKILLRGASLDAVEAFQLAERLKRCNEFGYARRLFGRLRDTALPDELKPQAVKIGLRQSLCTYKDTDLPLSDRFRRALEILDEVDGMACSVAERQESLGQQGAIYKRRWQLEGQRKDLLRSLARYQRGHALGAATDQGYNGINAALVYDLLAREEVAEAEVTAARWTAADEYWACGQQIRSHLVALLPGLPNQPDHAWMKSQWWFFATLAEAYFGLGRYDEAIDTLRRFNQDNGLTHGGPPLEIVPPWEFETTISQLGMLAQLQADVVEGLRRFPDWTPPADFSADDLRERARRALHAYLGDLAAGADRAFNGKLGLALSGGGFRASLFHIGVLARLAEQDLLRRVEVLSCVSGGSIIGAHYYLELRHLLQTKADGEITQQDYLDLVDRMARDFLAGVQTNIRATLFGDVLSNLRMLLQPGYTTTRRLAELYEERIYARIQDGEGHAPRLLKALRVSPKGEGAHFKPKYDNWRRHAKVPELVLNATTLNTGRNWQFTASWMGEPPNPLDAEIGGNYLLRRMYHDEAPRLRDKWHHALMRPFAPLDYAAIRLGQAVAASSCVPGLFEPLVMDDLFEGKKIRLVDGGVYDNQGVASLLEQNCTVMIVSDASGQMEAQDLPSGSRLGVPLRSFSVSMSRVRQAQFAELDARRRSGLLKGMMFMHLRKDLDASALDWRECQDRVDASDQAQPAARRGVNTSYVLSKEIQRLLSGIRTDLDSFTELEAYALMASGYHQTDVDLRQLPDTAGLARQARAWDFLQVMPVLTPGKGYDEVRRFLRIGSQIGGKVWCQDRLLMAFGVLVLVGAAAAGLRWCWVHREMTLLTVGSLCALAGVIALGVVLPHVTRLVRYQKTVRDAGLRALAGVVLALGFKLHLWLLDRRFLSLGRLDRHLKARH